MDQRERINDPEETMRVAIEGYLAVLWTAVPAIIKSFNAADCTCSAQPSIKAKQTLKDGTVTWIKLPVLIKVPVVFPQGGGFAVTFPVAIGDEALVVFASRCIDAWWQSGGVQNQIELRMHDLSDGFAIVGPRSVPRALANVSTTTAQLRNLDGTCYVELAPGGHVNIVAPGGLSVNGALNVTGAVVASGEGTFNGGHTVSAHKHPGVTTGAGITGTPTG